MINAYVTSIDSITFNFGIYAGAAHRQFLRLSVFSDNWKLIAMDR
jgi:hypothetical protein